MKAKNLAASTARIVCINPGAAAGTANGTHVDMAGYDSVLFILLYASGLSAANTPVLSAQQGDASNDSDMANISGTATAALAAAVASQSLEIVRPAKRYVRPVVTCNGANEVYSVVALLNAKNIPGGPAGPQGTRPPGTALVPTDGTFNTTTGTFDGTGNVKSAVTAAKDYVQIISNP